MNAVKILKLRRQMNQANILRATYGELAKLDSKWKNTAKHWTQRWKKLRAEINIMAPQRKVA